MRLFIALSVGFKASMKMGLNLEQKVVLGSILRAFMKRSAIQEKQCLSRTKK
jgi:hypothetical protein